MRGPDFSMVNIPACTGLYTSVAIKQHFIVISLFFDPFLEAYNQFFVTTDPCQGNTC